MSDGRLPARRRWVGWIIGLLVVFVLLATGWVFFRGFGAVSELNNVRSATAQLHSAIGDRAFDRADRIAPRIVDHAALATDLTSDPVWRTFEFIPWVGPNLTAMREVAEVTSDVASDAARPIIGIARDIDLATVGFTGSRVDLVPLQTAREPLAEASVVLADADARAQRIDADLVLPAVADAVREAKSLIHDTSRAVGALHGATELLPTMLGNAGPRTFLIAVQNNAELRSQGGSVSALMLVRADRGALQLVRTVSAGAFATLESPLELDEATVALFGEEPGRRVSRATAIADFTGAAEKLATRWEQTYHEAVDAVIAVDLVAAAHLVDATGSVEVGSSVANGDSFVTVVGTELPQAVPGIAEQNAVIAQVSEAVLTAALHPGDPAQIIDAVAAAAGDDRIRIWSAHAEEQEKLAASALGGTIPADDDRSVHIGVLLGNATGGRTDAYADAAFTTAVGTCDGQPTTQVTVTWANTMPAEVAESAPAPADTEPGTIRTIIAIYGPEGATLADDETAAVLSERPVDRHVVTLAPGETASVTASFVGRDAGDRMTTLHHTPILGDPDITRGEVVCG